MRAIQRFVFYISIFGCVLLESAIPRPLPPGAADLRTAPAAAEAGFNPSAAQVRTPGQIGNGRLPKELIDNLRKIERLAKHIKGEIS